MLLVPPYAKGGKVYFLLSIFELKKDFYSPRPKISKSTEGPMKHPEKLTLTKSSNHYRTVQIITLIKNL